MVFLPLTGGEITVPVAEIVVNVVSFLLNGSFLAALYSKKRFGIPYNRGDVFVMNIALVDLLVTSRFMWEPVFITGANDAVCFLDAFWPLAFLGVEMCLVFGLSLERYLGVVHAVRADKRVGVYTLAASWLMGFLVDGVLSILISTYGPVGGGTGCALYWWQSRGVSVWISLQLLLIWVSLIFFYYRVWKVSSVAMQAANHSSSRDGERALALRLFLIVFLFLVCWTPALITFLYCAITGVQEPDFLSGLAGVFLCINTIVDPALFLWINPDNRRAFVALFTCATAVSSKTDKKRMSVGPSQRTTRNSQTRDISPSRAEVITPPASPSGVAPQAALPQLPFLQLALSSSDASPAQPMSAESVEQGETVSSEVDHVPENPAAEQSRLEIAVTA